MSNIDYYRRNPAWATKQWQRTTPPMPSFRPQSSWNGYDYFKSAVGSANVDHHLYRYCNDKVYSATLMNTANAVHMDASRKADRDAKRQHRRAYGGLGDILVMTPQEIGAAASYEVWRNWRYHNSILAQPLAGNVSRQRDALIGLVIGESAKLWQYTRRHVDSVGQAAASETAALAVARIFDQGNATYGRDKHQRREQGGGGAVDEYRHHRKQAQAAATETSALAVARIFDQGNATHGRGGHRRREQGGGGVVGEYRPHRKQAQAAATETSALAVARTFDQGNTAHGHTRHRKREQGAGRAIDSDEHHHHLKQAPVVQRSSDRVRR